MRPSFSQWDHGREHGVLEVHLQAEPLGDGVAEIDVQANDVAVVIDVLNRRHGRVDRGEQRAFAGQRRVIELRCAGLCQAWRRRCEQ